MWTEISCKDGFYSFSLKGIVMDDYVVNLFVHVPKDMEGCLDEKKVVVRTEILTENGVRETREEISLETVLTACLF